MNNKISQSICPKDDEFVKEIIHILENINSYFPKQICICFCNQKFLKE